MITQSLGPAPAALARRSRRSVISGAPAASRQQPSTRSRAKDNAFRYIAEEGMRATQHHEGRLTDQVDLNEVDHAGSAACARRRSPTTPVRAACRSSRPSAPPRHSVGLFGTVWGIYHALINIGIAGEASIDKVAGPVGEALIMTALGLAVAVPAVFGYNVLLRRNKVLIEKFKYFATDMHAYLLSGARVGTGDVSVKAGARPVGATAAARSLSRAARAAEEYRHGDERRRRGRRAA